MLALCPNSPVGLWMHTFVFLLSTQLPTRSVGLTDSLSLKLHMPVDEHNPIRDGLAEDGIWW